MSVHPDKTAWRAVDACGGKFPRARNDYDSVYEAGYEAALDAAMEAVRPADALTAELLAVLQSMVATVTAAIRAEDWKVDGACDPDRDLSRAAAAIRNATGAA